MIRYRLRTLLIFMTVLAILIGIVGRSIYNWDQQLKAEYSTAGVIRDVTQFVESHNGQWPKDWNDIPGGQYVQRYVHIKFDLSVDALVNDPKLIHSVIVPISGEHRTYPHAERQLDQFRDVLIRFREQPRK